MNDYAKIRVNPQYRRLSPSDAATIHHRSKAWLSEQLKQNNGNKVVIITHHAPSKLSVPEWNQDDILSAAYASHLDEVVEKSGARAWIHGHIHVPSDYRLGGTRVICNPKGYPDEMSDAFQPDLVIDV